MQQQARPLVPCTLAGLTHPPSRFLHPAASGMHGDTYGRLTQEGELMMVLAQTVWSNRLYKYS